MHLQTLDLFKAHTKKKDIAIVAYYHHHHHHYNNSSSSKPIYIPHRRINTNNNNKNKKKREREKRTRERNKGMYLDSLYFGSIWFWCVEKKNVHCHLEWILPRSSQLDRSKCLTVFTLFRYRCDFVTLFRSVPFRSILFCSAFSPVLVAWFVRSCHL